MKGDPSTQSSGKRETLILAAVSILSLAPYVAYHGLFSRLFWFGDEFDLIDQMDRLGFWRWTWLVFAENFVPVFKGLWGGAVLVFGGSYAAMIALVWLTHALNVALLGRLLRTCGMPWTAVFLAQVVFGLTSANLETLAWSVQWSSVLSVTFMLLALESFLRASFGRTSVGWVAASALSFSRGVLTGPLLALGCAWTPPGGSKGSTSRRAAQAVAYLAPAALVALLIAMLASGNHQHMAGHREDAAMYGLWYFCLNPAYSLLSVESWGWRTTALLGLLKVSLIVWALLQGRGRVRLLFFLLVAFDLGSAALLGVGRFHTGLPTTVGSRYQYASLVAVTPMAAFWFSQVCRRLPVTSAVRVTLATFAFFALGFAMIRGWSADLEPFTVWRGTESRRILFQEAAPDPNSVPGIPGLAMDRAKALVVKYNLH